MKKIILFALLLSIAGLSQATILNVDNNANRPSGYYEFLTAAINAASAGDTIYVYPSNTSYGTITLTKKLHLFGFGYDGSQGAVSKIEYFYLDTTATPSSNPSGSTIQGFTIINYINCQKPNINNIVVAGNSIDNYYNTVNLSTNCSGWLFTNNYIYGYLNLNNNTSIIISNNVFRNHSYGIYTSNSSTVVISNNLFMNWRYFNNVFNATVSNNIFIINSAANSTYMANNIFLNNLSYWDATNLYNLPPTGNTGSGNISNTDPQFETGLASGVYDYSKDYHLKTTSPGHNAGTDNTDIGPYGGTSPFVWGGAFSIPKVTQMIIKNPIINQGTNINVNVKAKKAEL
ncbi:MAG: hypothetical protein H8E98_04250 [Bacteroidetes bacterium]|nr:hypothetical protein [Bacteroidota bacterium]